MTPLDKHGLHGPNVPFAAFARKVGGPPQPGAAWWRIGASGARWIKLLYPEHRRADAELARALGLQVLVRAPGEGQVHHEQVAAMIAEFAGVASVLEIGNEPATDEGSLWQHAWYLDDVWQRCAGPAHAAGMQLCTPGWRVECDPPAPGGPGSLGARLRAVYTQYDALGVHLYDPFELGSVATHLARWYEAFRPKPVYITEYGIAARYLIPGQKDQIASDREKARRLAIFVAALPPYVVAAFLFLLGGTADFAAFTAGGYDSAGENSYWLSDAAWAALGQALAR